MEQNIQQQEQVNAEQAKLPTKTKIAAWWLKLCSLIIFLIGFIYMLLAQGLDFGPASGLSKVVLGILAGIPFTIFGILILASGIFLYRRKKWAWWVAFIIFILGFVVGICSAFPNFLDSNGRFSISSFLNIFIELPGNLPIYFFLIPLILLFLDRKNFWKVAR